MNFFRRKAKPTEPEQEVQTIVHRHIEIVHEREWVEVPAQPSLSADDAVAPKASKSENVPPSLE